MIYGMLWGGKTNLGLHTPDKTLPIDMSKSVEDLTRRYLNVTINCGN